VTKATTSRGGTTNQGAGEGGMANRSLATEGSGLRRVAVLRPGALGDAVLALPVVEALNDATPDGDVLVVGHPFFRLAVEAGLATRWLAFDDARLLGLFSSEGRCSELACFDLCVAFVRGQGNDLRAALARSGVCRSVLWPSHPPPGSHATDHLLGCLGEVGVAARRNRPRLEAQVSWLKAGRARLRDLGVSGDFVAIHPGSGGARKCWPLERFVEVASRLPLPVVWILGPAELERGGFDQVCDRSGCVVANPGLEELAGLLAWPQRWARRPWPSSARPTPRRGGRAGRASRSSAGRAKGASRPWMPCGWSPNSNGSWLSVGGDETRDRFVAEGSDDGWQDGLEERGRRASH